MLESGSTRRVGSQLMWLSYLVYNKKPYSNIIITSNNFQFYDYMVIKILIITDILWRTRGHVDVVCN